MIKIAPTVALTALLALQQFDPPTASNQTTILVSTIIGFLSLLATQIFGMIRENRNRKWDLQDRKDARDRAQRDAQQQRLDTVQTAIELAKVSHMTREQLLKHIEHNTRITQAAKDSAEAAYAAANNFNEKFSELKRELASKSSSSVTDRIDEISQDTNEKVTKILQDVPHAEDPSR